MVIHRFDETATSIPILPIGQKSRVPEAAPPVLQR